MRQLEDRIVRATGAGDEIRRAWATALAVAWLRDHATEFETEWSFLASKAERYLAGVACRPREGGAWIEVAVTFLATWSPRRPASSSAGA
jgi:hypothetical protein